MSAVSDPVFADPSTEIAPGSVLRMELAARRLSQSQLALRTGLSTKTINQIVQGTAPLTPDTALRLERALGTPSHMWNRLEAAYQDQETRNRSRENAKASLGWLRRFPSAELTKHKVIAGGDPQEHVEQLLNFFQVADVEAYRKVWSGPVASGFRRARHLKVNEDATALWLRLAEIEADGMSLDPYDPSKFGQVLPLLRGLTRLEDDDEALEKAQQLCGSAGVAIVHIPEVSGSRACGAARWTVSDRPMIALSGRYKYVDSFWFSLFHEAAHLQLHPKRQMYLHVEKPEGDNSDGLEEEADRFAARHLVDAKVARQMQAGLTFDQIRALADEAGVGVAIIAGQLCHRFDEWRRLAPLRRQINFSA